MAIRPYYRPCEKQIGAATFESPAFAWSGGFALSQKQKNVVALHAAVMKADPSAKPLEISSKSLQPLGVKLSAFNLTLVVDGRKCTVESVFQASKVFEGGIGPFPEKYGEDSRDVRHFVRDVSEGRHVIGFEFCGRRWPTEPKTAFYDHLYLTALEENPDLAAELLEYNAFTDIEFNPKRSINCQAAAAALYVSKKRHASQSAPVEDVNVEGLKEINPATGRPCHYETKPKEEPRPFLDTTEKLLSMKQFHPRNK